jgi:hypothetical protein
MDVLSNKKEFNRLLRKKYRQFRHKLLNKIAEVYWELSSVNQSLSMLFGVL